MIRRFIISYLWIAILVSGLVILTDQKIISREGTWNILELKALDFRFLFKAEPRERTSRDIALIAIDDKSYKSINQPLIYYHTYISQVIDYLVKNGVRVIGLDIQLPSISLEERVLGGYDSVYTRAFLNARKKGVEVVIGFSSQENAPLQAYLAAAGRDNLSVFGLTQDKDDFIRRQELWFEEGAVKYDSFPFLLAKKFAGETLSVPGQTILIDYSLLPGIPVYSFDEIYHLSQEGADKKDFFKDKIVIIGTLLTHEDRHPTPLYYYPSAQKHKGTAGIMIQAATLNTLLSGSYFHEPAAVTGALYILIIAIISVYLCFKYRPLSAALFCLGEIAAIVLTSLYAFSHLYLLHLVPLVLVVLISYGATTVFHYYTQERKIIKIRNRFASYVPEKIIEQLINADLNKLTEGEQKEVALLFCDIRNFTAYSEKNKSTPKKVVHFLNYYHSLMTGIILSNEGTVAQLTGDGIFAFFGAPVSLADPVLAAVKSALGMKNKVSDLRSEWQAYGMDDLRIGIGIHVGSSIIGNIGSVNKMAYGAIGDSTNVASRIEGLTKEYRETILLSAAAYERVRNCVQGRFLGKADIKGHTGVDLYAVDGINDI